MSGGGGIIGDIVDAIGGLVEDTADVVGDVVNAVFDVAGDVVSIVSPDAGNFLKQVGTVFNTTFDVIGQTVEGIITDPGKILRNPASLIELGLAAGVMYLTGNPYPLIAYAVVQIGTIDGFVKGLVDANIIPPEQAVWFNIALTAAVKIYAWSGVKLPGGFTTTLFGVDISVNLAYIQNALTAIGAVQSIFTIFQTAEALAKLKDYLEKMRSYLNSLQAAQKDEDFQTSLGYATGRYYRYFAGQPLFNPYLPSRERYETQDVQLPSYGILNKPPYQKVDDTVARIGWDDWNYDMPGNYGFIKKQMQYQFIGNS